MFCKRDLVTGVDVNLGQHFLRCDTISRDGLNAFRTKRHFSDVVLDVFGSQIYAHKVKHKLKKEDQQL